MKLSANIALLLSCAASTVLAGSSSTSTLPDAQTLYSQTISQYAGDGQTVQNNLVNPLLSTGNLKSMDGKTNFSVTTLTGSTKPIMRLQVNVNPPTGDILSINIEQDPASSGTLTTAATFPTSSSPSGQMIAALCANGYIQCKPNTFSNCEYYLWSTDPATGLVSAINTPTTSVSDMQSCYCFNQFCTNPNNASNTAVMNIDSLTSDVLSGVIASFVSASNYAITSVQSSGLGSVDVFGKKPTGTIKNLTPNTSLTSLTIGNSTDTIYPYADTTTLESTFYQNPTALDSMGQTSLASQEGTSNSLYNVVFKSVSPQSGDSYTCHIRRSVSVTAPTVTLKKDGGPSIPLCIDHYSFLRFTQTAPFQWSLKQYGTNPQYEAFWNCGGWGVNDLDTFNPFSAVSAVDMANYAVTRIEFDAKSSGAGCTTMSGGTIASDDMTFTPSSPAVNAFKDFQSGILCPASEGQYPVYSEWTWTITYQQQLEQESITDECSTYETNASCQLQQETWDGRPVVVNGTPTGFQMSQITENFPGPLRNVQVAAPWWTQIRVYHCTNQPVNYNLAAILARTRGVENSSKVNSPTMTYTDGGSSHTYTVPAVPSIPSCRQICKVQTPVAQSLVNYSNVESNYQTQPAITSDASKLSYRACTADSSGHYTCPTVSGETKIADCQCGGDFSEALTSLNGINDAQDAICSQN